MDGCGASGPGGARILVSWSSTRRYSISATSPGAEKKPGAVVTLGSGSSLIPYGQASQAQGVHGQRVYRVLNPTPTLSKGLCTIGSSMGQHRPLLQRARQRENQTIVVHHVSLYRHGYTHKGSHLGKKSCSLEDRQAILSLSLVRTYFQPDLHPSGRYHGCGAADMSVQWCRPHVGPSCARSRHGHHEQPDELSPGGRLPGFTPDHPKERPAADRNILEQCGPSTALLPIVVGICSEGRTPRVLTAFLSRHTSRLLTTQSRDFSDSVLLW
jgi:hypothetical protein